MLSSLQLVPKAVDTGVSPAATPSPGAPHTGLTGTSPASDLASASAPADVVPLWPVGTPLTLLVYLTTSPTPLAPAPPLSAFRDLEPTVRWDGLEMGRRSDKREEELWLDVPRQVMANGSWWADMFLVAGAAEGEAADAQTSHELELGPMRVMRTRKRAFGVKDGTEGVWAC